jgi:tetratricopeptide (TPR) repeat protein
VAVAKAEPQVAAPSAIEAEPVLEPAGDAFDLAAELAGALGSEAPSATARSMEGEGFQEVFAAFKAGVQREVGDGDTEAHYDLGIAYKEMGLLDDAIGEFRIAMGDPARRLACLHLMGVCALDLGRASDAEAHLSQALAGGALPAQQEAALRVDLGRVYRALGDASRARSSYEEARRIDPNFEGIDALLDELVRDAVAPADAVAGSERFESFDELMGEAAAAGAAARAKPGAPAYESFDDLIDDDAEPRATAEPAPVAAAEIELEDAADPVIDEPAPAEPEVAPPPSPTPPPAAKEKPAPDAAPARRKKKISFV